MIFHYILLIIGVAKMEMYFKSKFRRNNTMKMSCTSNVKISSYTSKHVFGHIYYKYVISHIDIILIAHVFLDVVIFIASNVYWIETKVT